MFHNFTDINFLTLPVKLVKVESSEKLSIASYLQYYLDFVTQGCGWLILPQLRVWVSTELKFGH